MVPTIQDNTTLAVAGTARVDEEDLRGPLHAYRFAVAVTMDGASACMLQVRGPDGVYRDYQAMTGDDIVLLDKVDGSELIIGGFQAVFTAGTAPSMSWSARPKEA